MKLKAFFNSIDSTKRFNTSTALGEKGLFFIKLVTPAVVGALVTWQIIRLGATVLQGSGRATEWVVDKSAAPIKRLAEKSRFYNPNIAHVLYTATKRTGQMLNIAGKTLHQSMDMLIQSSLNVCKLGKL